MSENNKLDSWLNRVIGGEKKPAPQKDTQPAKPADVKKVSGNQKSRPSRGRGGSRGGNSPAQPANTKPGQTHPAFTADDGKLRIVPHGGQEEVGRNMNAFCYGGEVVIIDCGLQFPGEGMLGIDYVVPDVAPLEGAKNRIKGILITHGHLDHIGALPHILPKLDFPPIFGTKLTLGLSRARLAEFGLEKKTQFREIDPGKGAIKLGKHFQAEFFRVNHSIPDSTGIALQTPVGQIVHTGDFKVDFTPADGIPADFGRIAEIGRRGVTLAMADSTNAQKTGYTMSESVVGQNLEKEIEQAKGRIVLATFSSIIGRIQHILNAAHRSGRKVFISGRSMKKNIEMAVKMGYLKVPQGLLRELKKGSNINDLPPNKVMILCTGSQGEELSALTRISLGDHPTIKIKPGDTVIFSSTPIIGNERAVVTVTDNLIRLGATVLNNKKMDLHVSGHAHQEDLKMMHSLLKPKHLIPVHGELHMRAAHRDLAGQVGIPEGNVHLLDNGDIIEIDRNKNVRKSKSKLRIGDIMIDGLGVGDIGTQVIRERQAMSDSGIVFVVFKAYASSRKLVGDPEILSRGFIYMKESASIVDETKQAAKKAFEQAIAAGKKEHKDIRFEVMKSVERLIRQRLDREPLVMPFIVWI